jgi:uncharacterized protein
VFFKVRDLAIKPGLFDVAIAPGELDFLDPKVRQTGLLRATGKIDLSSEMLSEIRVKGHVSVEMEADCDRCLEPAKCPVDQDFLLQYQPASEDVGEELALDPNQVELGFYEGDGVELNDVLREFVMLALPMQRLCGEDCQGLCSVCGQNRNQQACQCVPAAVGDRWAALKQVKIEKS